MEQEQKNSGTEVLQHGVVLSKHAQNRLAQRNIELSGDDFLQLKDAIHRLKNKGGQNSLVITKDANYIIDVDKQKIVTAIGRDEVVDNIFTKIDSTLILN